MFDNLQKVRIYEEALELLADPSVNDREVWVHDYYEPCYREKKGYTLNRLHWDYPDSIVDDITNKRVQGVRSFYSARFVGTLPQDAEKWNFANNSRFSKVKYKEIKEIVELGIRQKLEQARINSQEDIKALEAWKRHVQKKYGQCSWAALRIEDFREQLKLIALDPERFDTYGFGSFLKGIKKGEISVSPRALEIIAHSPARSGVMGLELFDKKILSMIGTNPIVVISPNSVSVNYGAYGWFSEVSKVQ